MSRASETCSLPNQTIRLGGVDWKLIVDKRMPADVIVFLAPGYVEPNNEPGGAHV